MRHDIESCDQGLEDQDKAWLDGPVASVKGKSEALERWTVWGGTTLDTHDRPHGLRPQGRPNPQDEALRGTTLLGAFRKTPERYSEDTRSIRIHMIP